MSRATGALMLALAVLAVSGCQQGGAPSNGLVHVANLASVDAAFHWQSPGIFGGSGTEPISACSLYIRGFAPGDQQLMITTSQGAKSFALAAPPSGQAILWLVIEADGSIEETAATDAPPSPYCDAPPSIARQRVVPATELPPPSTLPFPGARWTFQGSEVGSTYITLIEVPEHCGIPDVLLLTMGRPFGQEMHTSDDAMQFIRDPDHRLGDRTAVSFEPSIALPPDAHFTGLRYGDLEVWSSDRLLDQALFVVRDDIVERWPRVPELVACA